MIFQNININIAPNYECMKICSEHFECKGCPLKKDDMNLQNGMIRCETGKTNNCEN